MHHHAPGLVYDDDIVILKHHIERDILRNKLRFLRLGETKPHRVAALALVIFPYRFSVHANLSCVQQLLRRRAGEAIFRACKESVDTLAALLCNNFDNFHYRSLNSASIDSRSYSSAGFALGVVVLVILMSSMMMSLLI